MHDPHDDSTLMNLRELMAMEEERIQTERSAQMRAEVERRRLEAEAAARAEAEMQQQARDAERAKLEAERAARETAAAADTAREASALAARLEAEAQARIAAISAELTHREALAAAELAQTRGRVSGATAATWVGLVVATVLTTGFVLHQRSETRAAIAALRAQSESAARAASPVRVEPTHAVPIAQPAIASTPSQSGEGSAPAVAPVDASRRRTGPARGTSVRGTTPTRVTTPGTNSLERDLDNLDRASRLPGSDVR